MKMIALLIAVAAYTASAVPAAPAIHVDLHNKLELPQNWRIVGGKDAEKFQFPYQASLRWSRDKSNFRHICGGTLINANWVLTAGHCNAYSYGYYEIVLGQLIQNEQNQDIQKFAVVQFIVHPNYSGGVATNDIALIQLSGPAEFTKAVQPASLPASENCEAIGKLVLSGWGKTSSNNPGLPSHLQWIEIPRLTNQDCAIRLISLLGTSRPLDNTMICTGANGDEKQSACNGDSGGPLVQNQDELRFVVGVVSWGITPCATKNAPSVFTKVCSHIDFINNHIGV